MKIETWTSDKGDEEIHHFVEGEQNTYIFGINRKLLGDEFYNRIREQIEDRLSSLNHSPWNFCKNNP